MPYDSVKKFEKVISEYCGAKYGIAVSSCTNAIFLCLQYLDWMMLEPELEELYIPHKTYPGVGMALFNTDWFFRFTEERWNGEYKIGNTGIIDSALRFKKGMFHPDEMRCISFHHRKHIPIGRGGMILTNDNCANEWLRKARFDGRDSCALKDQKDWSVPGWNMYMTPEQAARGLVLFNNIKDKELKDIDDYNTYPDLSKMEIFK